MLRRQVYRQFGPNPDEHSHDAIQNFRRRVLRELKKIKLAWPGLNYATGRGPLDPLSLDTRRSSGFGTSRIKSAKAPSWPLSGLSAPGWTLGIVERAKGAGGKILDQIGKAPEGPQAAGLRPFVESG